MLSILMLWIALLQPAEVELAVDELAVDELAVDELSCRKRSSEDCGVVIFNLFVVEERMCWMGWFGVLTGSN